MNKYDWIIVGGGISGITTAEILTREGLSVLLLEKNNTLASETSKVFHEWLHTGALYTLAPDNLNTTRYLLGAIDDLLEFYQSYPGMNLIPSSAGLKLNKKGWFNNKSIEMHYRNRRLNPVWMSLVSRSINVVEKINSHDWLRRRAGSIYGETRLSWNNWISKVPDMVRENKKFIEIETSDITINSRELISDIFNNAINNGLDVTTGVEVKSIKKIGTEVNILSKNELYTCENVLICAPDLIEKLFDKKIKVSHAPIGVFENVPEEAKNFVELDYYKKNCINLICKGNGIALAGGISVKEAEIKSYTDFIFKQHKKKFPAIELIDSYVGLKKEIVSSGQDRNYLYHIEKEQENVWSLVLGKFTLAFSSAPELIRRVYGRNPKKIMDIKKTDQINSSISKTSWQEILELNKKRSKNGDD